MDDVRKVIYGTLIVFVAGILAWIAYLYVSACGFTTSCQKAAAAEVVDRTPIPTLIPATLPALRESGQSEPLNKCQVAAANMIGAWVSAGYPEREAFSFTDEHGKVCQASFEEDVRFLFTEGDLWYPGALACDECHNADVTVASAQLDLSTYQGILAGSRRSSADAKGNDILAGGDWEASLLYEILFTKKFMPPGHPPESPAEGPVIFAGTPM